jgi:hypothetical protein
MIEAGTATEGAEASCGMARKVIEEGATGQATGDER